MWHQGSTVILRSYVKFVSICLKKFESNLSPPRHPSAILESIHWTYVVVILIWTKTTYPAWRSWHRTVYIVYVQRILSKMALGWREGDGLLNKVVIFFYFAHKRCSCRFVKLRLNPWCHMDYFTDLLAMFLDLGTFQLYCCLCRVRQLSDSIKNILICVPKMNEGLTGLKRHEGE